VRSEEARCAARELHINPPVLLGLEDGKLSTNESYVSLHRKVDSLFNALKPDIVLTWGPDGGYGHPDHRAVSNIVTEVYQLGGNNAPKKLLYAGFPSEALKDLPNFKTYVGKWLSTNFHTLQEKYLSYRIPYDDQDLQAAKTSYLCHKTQWTPEMEDDIFLLLSKAGKFVYLRSWNGDTRTHTDLFE
jgi:LmbE family N-acetylglucosaminyl deacetylase